MDNFLTLIENIVSKKIAEASFSKTLPCVVQEVVSENRVVVKSLSTGAVFTVPNWSGSSVSTGEKVQVFYNGSLCMNSGAYIGASLNKNTEIDVPDPIHIPILEYVSGDITTGGTITTGTKIATIGFTSGNDSNCFVVINITFTGTQSNNITIKTVLDDVELPYAPQITTVENEITHFSCTIPITADFGNHVVNIMCYGAGYVESANCFVFGMDIKEYFPYKPTNTSDYVYVVQDGGANVIYYLGNINDPEIPKLLNYATTTKLLATSFDHSDVERVKIPEGVVEIE